jgi:hypothetical protein
MARTIAKQLKSSASRAAADRGGAKSRTLIKGQFVEPVYVMRLMSHVGPRVAADLIGTTPGTLHKGRQNNAVKAAIETAARGVWIERGFIEGEDPDEAREKAGTTIIARRSRLSRPDPLPPLPATAPTAPAPHITNMNKAMAPEMVADGTVLYLIQVAKERAAILERTAEALGATIISHA